MRTKILSKPVFTLAKHSMCGTKGRENKIHNVLKLRPLSEVIIQLYFYDMYTFLKVTLRNSSVLILKGARGFATVTTVCL